MAFDPSTAQLDSTFDPDTATESPDPGFKAGDYLKGLKRGVLGVPGALTGLADIPIALATGERVAGPAADALGKVTGFQPSKWAKETGETFSPGAKAAQAKIEEAWKGSGADRLGNALLGNFDDLPAAWRDADLAGAGSAIVENPGASALQVLESVPGMLAGGAIGKGVAVASKLAPAIAGAIGEGAITAGQQMDQTDAAVDPRRAAATSATAGALTGAIAGGMGRVAQKLGLEDIQTTMAGGKADATGLGRAGRLAGGAASEALQEIPQSAQEQFWQNVAEEKPLGEGVIRSGVEGAIAGGVMGAGANLRRPGAPAPAPGAVASGDIAEMDTLNAGLTQAGNDYAGQLPPNAGLLEEKPLVVQNPTTGVVTEIDRRGGPLEQAAAIAVESGAHEVAQNVDASEILFPYANARAAQDYIGRQADPEMYDAVPHPRVEGRTAVVPKTGPARQAILDKRAAGAANEQAKLRGEQLKQDESPAPTEITESIAGTFGNGSTGNVTITPQRGGGFEIRVTSSDGATKRSSVAGFPAGTNRARAIAVATRSHGGFTKDKPVVKAKPVVDTTVADAAQDELAPPTMQPVTDMPGVQQRAKAQAQGAVATAQTRAAQLADEENIDSQAQAANPEPSEAQRTAGNYTHGHIRVGGLEISVETPAGAVRTGTDKGKTWKVKNTAHYGYVKRTQGADGEQVDVYVKPGTSSTSEGPVFVVDQYNPATGAFDEHKALLGYSNQAEAAAAYDAHFNDKSGPKRRGAVTQMSLDAFKGWLARGDTSKAVSGKRFGKGVADNEQAAQDEIARSTGKMSLPRSAQKPGEPNAAFELRRAAATQAAKTARVAGQQALPTKEGDKAGVREALGMPDDAEVSILSAESRPDAGKAKGVSKQAAQFIQQVARIFGKRVVFFDVPDRGAAEGFYVRGNTIYLNTNSSTQHLRILGHELTHAMKRQAREAYEKMLGAVATLRTDEEMAAQYADYFGRALDDVALLDQPHPGSDGTLREFLAEEWMADLGGNRFAEAEFWTSVFGRLEGQHGTEAAKGIVAKLRLALVAALNKLKTMITGNAFAVDARLGEHLEGIRTAVAEGFAEYARLSKAGQLAEVSGEAKFAPAWHGTPHVWEPEPGFPHGRPRLDKMGTGEGAQAYGWGWYSAEAQGVAEGYRTAPGAAFAVDGKTYAQLQNGWFDLPKPERRAITALADSAGNSQEALVNLAAQITPESKAAALLLRKWIDEGRISASKGTLYHLDIPDEVMPHLLDWDKPLSEQTLEVQNALAGSRFLSKWTSAKKRGAVLSDPRTANGADAYFVLKTYGSDFKGMGSDKLASEYLASLGIPGLRYLDGNTRNRPPLTISTVKGFGGKTRWEVKGLHFPAEFNTRAAAEKFVAQQEAASLPTSNFVIWDQPTLDKVALLKRNGEALDAIRAAFSPRRPERGVKPTAVTYTEENRTGVIVGARPGEFDWTFSSGTTPPPIQHPTQAGPRMERMGPAVHKILQSGGAKKLFEDAFGITGLEVHPTLGSYKGKPEPSYTLYGSGLEFNAADGLSRMLGFAFAQESTIVTQPVYAGDEDTWPALYVGSGKKLTPDQIEKVRKAAADLGLDYSTSVDGRAFKFFFDGDDYDVFHGKVVQIAKAGGLSDVIQFETRSQFNAAETYLQSGDRPGERQAWYQEGGTGPSRLFGRTVDHLLVPYAKAVAGEGYRFSPDLFAERFGLRDEQREYIRAALRPKRSIKLSTADIVSGKETLEPAKSDFRAKTPRPNNSDILFALQNRAAQNGQIGIDDRSDEAKAAIAAAIADEVLYHISRPGGKSAIGWYDAALKRAKAIYDRVFPELATNRDREMLFDAMMGIGSQGNDVHSNSMHAGRMYHLVVREGDTVGQAVKKLFGTFGGETRAIENNFLKLEALLDRNGPERMREVFNRKMSVGEWNAVLRQDPSLFYGGSPLKIKGAARQTATGWMVFGPKIGSFINNLHGDYSTLTADLWFSRTWNRLLGFSFLHTPAQEAPKYQAFKEALLAEHTKTTEPKTFKPSGAPVYWLHGEDIHYSNEELDALLADPEAMLRLAEELNDYYKSGFTFSHDATDKTSGYSVKSDLRRAAKNWIEHRQNSVAVPRNDSERAFQQDTVEAAQKIINRKSKENITIADIQAALWYHEKELFQMFGAGDASSAPADYADAAANFMEKYDNGDLFYVEKPTPRYIIGSKGSYLRRGGAGLSPQRGVSGPDAAGDRQLGRDAEAGLRRQVQPESVSAVGVHYSREPRERLSSRYFGTGIRGAEVERVASTRDARIKQRIYFYVNGGRGIKPEEGVGSHAHQAQLDNLYDYDNDPLDLRVTNTASGLESAVLDNGFDGAVSHSRGIAVLLGQRNLAVEYIGQNDRPDVPLAEQAEPSPFGKQLRAVAANRGLPSGEMTGADWKRLMPKLMPDIDVSHLNDEQKYYKDEIIKRPQAAKLSTSRTTDPYANPDIETRPGTTEEQRTLGRDALAALERRLGRFRDSRGQGASLVGTRLYKSFVATGGAQLVGQHVASNADLAVLAQVYRDPRFETFRAIYTKQGKVVGETAYSSRLPGVVRLGPGITFDMRSDFERLGADGVYMVHNHPSGWSTPSPADIYLTQDIAKAVPMLGHVVIDHNEYSTIDADGTHEVVRAPELAGINFSGDPAAPHPFLDRNIDGPPAAASMAKELQAHDALDAPVLILTKGPRSEVDLIAKLPTTLLGGLGVASGRAKAWLRSVGRTTGAGGYRFILVSDDTFQQYEKPLKKLLGDNLITDVVSASGASLVYNGVRTEYGKKDVFEALRDAKPVKMSTQRLAPNGPLPGTLNIDGVERPTTNSKGKPIAQDEEGLRNFWRWFGDSKAVEAVNADTGKPVTSSREPKLLAPLVVYHTTRNDIGAFEVGRETRNSGTFGDWDVRRHAIFVTPDLDASQEYGKVNGLVAKRANTLPLYVKAERPLDLTEGVSEEAEEKLVGAGMPPRAVIHLGRWDMFDDENGSAFVNAAKAAGYDSVIFNDENPETGEPFEAWALFDANQLKSAVGNTGAFSTKNDDIRYSPPRFVSQLARTFENAPAKLQTQPAAQWKLWLAGQQAVKKDEIAWSGINDWLDLQGKAKVSRAQIQEYLAHNGVQLGEKVLGKQEAVPEPELSENDIVVTSEDEHRWRLTSPSGKFVLVGKGTVGETDAKEYGARYFNSHIRERNREAQEDVETGFAAYQLPGGQNYRELLITLPDATSYSLAERKKLARRDSERQLTAAEQARYAELQRETKGKKPVFQSSHFDEPNILAHVRFNERVDTDGNKVLFLEELQSDWGQQGKRKGFKTEQPPLDTTGWRLVVEQDKTQYYGTRDVKIYDAEGNWVSSRSNAPSRFTDAELIAQAAASQQSSRLSGRVEPGPFVTDTKAWTALALKRAALWAVQHGFRKVAWATGEQQAERYDLSRQVDSISYGPVGNEKYDVVVQGPGGGARIVFRELGIGLPRIEEVLGKEIAKKMEAREGERAQGRTADAEWYQLSGLDLKVGGEGMKAYYDSIVPQVANELLRKVGGGKVEPVEIKVPAGDRGATRGYWNLAADAPHPKQPGFTITPGMAAKVTNEGLPLFSLRRALNGEHNTDDHLVPETPLYLDNPDLVDLAYANGKPIRLNVGADNGPGNGRGALHLIATAEREKGRALDQATDDEGENVVRTVLRVLGSGSSALHHQAASRYALRVPLANRTLILQDRGDHYSIVTMLPSAQNKWGDSDWTGRLTFPATTVATTADPLYPDQRGKSSPAGLTGIGYLSEKFKVTPDAPLVQSPGAAAPRIVVKVAQKKHRTLDVAAMAADGLAAKKSPVRANLGAMTPAQAVAANNVLGSPKTFMQRLAEFRKDWAKNLKQGIFDQFAPIAELDPQAYIQARLSKGGESTLEALMLYGKLFVGADGATDVRYTRAGGKQGFAGKMSALKGEHDRFLLWVAAQRADRLQAIGLENLWTPQDIATLKGLDQGAMKDGTARPALYAQALQDLNEFNDNVLDVAVSSGLIDDATRQMYAGTPYVPFYRLQEDDSVSGFGIKPGLVNQYAWKKLKGGTQKLNEDLLANLLHNWSHLITASAKNRAAKATLDAAATAGIAAQVPVGMPGKGHVSYMAAGQEQVFVVSDPHLFDAVAALHYAGLGPWAKPLSAAKHWLTIGVTANPAFKLRNLIRDSIGALGSAQLSYNVAGNIHQGWQATAEDNETRAHLLASGGMIRFGSMLDGKNSQRAADLIHEGVDPAMILDSDAKIKKFWKRYVHPALSAYNEFGDRTENINRAALYEQLIAKGLTNAEAAYWSRDLMDFAMSGKWTAIRTLTQTVPFFNARLQGLYKLGRAGKQDIRRLGTVLGAVSLSSLALLLAYGDDDDWKKRSDADRNNYWWFKVGGHAFRVPKPFEIGAVGTLAERGYELMFEKEMTSDRFGRNMRDIVMSQLSMNPVPQLFKPMMDIYANKDSFTGRDIESMGMERLRKQDRYDEKTSEVARFLGSLGLPDVTQLVMGRWDTLSPKQVDFLARGYFSWLGTMTTTAIDYGIRPMLDRGARPDLQLKDVFFAGNFVESLPSNQSRYLTQLYDQAREIEQAYASYHHKLKVGDIEGAKAVREDDGALIRRYASTESMKRAESLMNQQLQRINASTTLSGEEKRVRLDQVYARRNALAERFQAQ